MWQRLFFFYHSRLKGSKYFSTALQQNHIQKKSDFFIPSYSESRCLSRVVSCRRSGCSTGGLPPSGLDALGRTAPVGPLPPYGRLRFHHDPAEEHLGELRLLRHLQDHLHASHHRGNVSLTWRRTPQCEEEASESDFERFFGTFRKKRGKAERRSVSRWIQIAASSLLLHLKFPAV